ncbi:hypothetical protein D3C85_1066420 [compost metagenome]
MLDNRVQVLATRDPGRVQLIDQQPLGQCQVLVAIGIQDFAEDLVIHVLQAPEFIEAGLVFITVNGGLVAGLGRDQTLLEALVLFNVVGVEGTFVRESDQALGQHEAVDPGTADHGTGVQARNAVCANALLARLDGGQTGVGGNDHQQHDRDDDGETRQYPLAQSPILHSQPLKHSTQRAKNGRSIAHTTYALSVYFPTDVKEFSSAESAPAAWRYAIAP